ncbi:MAG: hypothetical protein FD122_2517 [Stygiobacter sp.]|nr:MAG: hypothetical protein FD122_2517 [Stygiobacter sp.]KAF0217103.1 MAG: hypothetical protein FD178_858 [Ignavibacteria bacterium]
MNKLVFAALLFIAQFVSAQDKSFEQRTGRISFVTSQNIYVRFESTNGINKNDTLYIADNGKFKPAIVVQYVSSNSCSGLSVTNYQFKVEDAVIALVKKVIPPSEEIISEKKITQTEPNLTPSMVEPVKVTPLPFMRLNGNISISSYSNKSNGPSSADFQHWRVNFSFDADTIARSPLFLSSYINFSYRADKWNEVKNNIGNALKVYDLALRYEFTPATKLTLGRKINFKTSSLGAIDGIQFETSFKKFVVGIIAGSHPSFTDYGYDLKMFEYGGYVFRSDTLGTVSMQNTLGVFNQTNNFKTDRRFLYFQHTNNLSQSLGFFVSSEFDLYKRQKGVDKNIFDMTSLFAMCSYNPSSWIGFSASYDARKNVIYYETFRTFADSILESATRQGFTARVNVRPLNYIWLGVNYGYRFSKDDPRPSKNYGVNFSYIQTPLFSSTLYINYNRIESGYVTGNYYGASLAKDLFNGWVNLTTGYKRVEYKFASGTTNFFQQIGNVDLSWRILSSLFFTASYEGTFQDKQTYGRLYVSLSKRLSN